MSKMRSCARWNSFSTGSNRFRRDGVRLVEPLEDRHLLAADPLTGHMAAAPMAPQPYVAQSIRDPFERHAVTVDDMIARTGVYPYVPAELVVAFETTNASARPSAWAERLGVAEARVEKTLLSTETAAGRSVSLVRLQLDESADVIQAMRELSDDLDVLWSAAELHSHG